MLKHYLLITLRNLIKDKTQSFVAILGLVVGLATTVVILIINYSELTWDKQWEDGDRIFELQQVFKTRATPTKLDTVSTLRQMTMIEERFSDIEHVGNITTADGEVKLLSNTHQNQNNFRQNISYITPNIIDIFSLTAIKGNTKEFYTNKQSVILSEKIAQKLFPGKNPVGQTIEVQSNSYVPIEKDIPFNTNYKVIAVIANTQKRTSLRGPLELMINSNYPIQHDDPNFISMKDFSATYAKIKRGKNVDAINLQFPDFLDKDVPNPNSSSKKNSAVFSFSLINIQDIHLHGFNSEKQLQQIFILYSLAAIIFVLASINYINLTTARFSHRQKEVALRKTLGAAQHNIFAQFLMESLISVGCALLITFIILEPLLPWLNTNLNIKIETNYYSDPSLLTLIFGTSLCMGLITGFYPGLILSRTRPAEILKANKSHETKKSIRFRNLLVMFQFILSSTMLVSVGIMATQLHSVLHKNVGYETKNIVFLADNSLIADKGTINHLKEKILSVPGVLATTKAAPLLPGSFGEYKTAYSSKQKAEDASPALINMVHSIDEFQLFDFRLIAGKKFVLPEQDGNKPNVIINEQALKGFGFTSAQEAIGMTLTFTFADQPTIATIIGVTSKLHFGDFNKPTTPLILMRTPDGWNSESGTLGVRFAPNINHSLLLKQLKEACKNVTGMLPEGEVFMEDIIQEQYKHQIVIAQFAYTCAALAMLISCLGLYALLLLPQKSAPRKLACAKFMAQPL